MHSRSSLARAEQIAMVYRNAPMTLGGNVIMSALLVVVLWTFADRVAALAWMSAVWLQAFLRCLLWLRYRSKQADADAARRWGCWFSVGCGVSGCIWGIGAHLLLVPSRVDQELLLLFVLIGMGSSSVYSLGYYLPALRAFLFPCLALAALAFAVRGEPLEITLAFMVVVYLGVTYIFARNMNRSFSESLRLRYENVDLLEDLRVKKEEAEEASAAKSRFLAAASHDLRQPMHALGLFVGALRASRVMPEHEREALIEHIRHSVEAMDGLFTSLLDISKLDAKVVQPTLEHFRIETVLTRVALEYTAQAEKKGLALRVVPSSIVLYSDAALLERIVRNLVSNAIRYTRAGSVLVGCRRRCDHACIQVLDTGPGIPDHAREAVFLEFYQLDNPERDRSQGLGLGLAIVRRLSELLDCKVTLASEVGRGTCFTVDVPYGNEALEERASASIHPYDLFGRLVVVVDDELAIREAMRALLSGWGCRVIVGATAEEVTGQLAAVSSVPDLIVSDYRLRGQEDGISAIEWLHQEYNDCIPALLVTGDTAPERLREAERSGFPLLHKPVDPGKLRALIGSVLSSRSGSS